MTAGYSRAMLDDYASSVAQLTVRAEGLTDLDGTFVETIFPEMIQAPQHQIIYGRRGSGKTHLLRRVDVGLRKTFSKDGVLPIYVNGSRLSQGIGIVSSDPAMVALTIYVELMQHIGTEIRRFVAELNQANFWNRAVGGGKSQVAKQADTIAAELEQTLTSGQVRLFPRGEVSEEMTTLSE